MIVKHKYVYARVSSTRFGNQYVFEEKNNWMEQIQ